MPKTSQNLKNYRSKMKRKEIYFTPGEMERFNAVALKENTKAGVVIRNMALAYLQGNRLPEVGEKKKLESIEKELHSLSLLMRNIANNVNQMAYHSNSLNYMVEEQDLLEYLRKLDDSIKNTVNNLTIIGK
ncbi:MAG: hypothetical protein RPR97_12570 [Colwellia sp.]|jgi:hypothetical protein